MLIRPPTVIIRGTVPPFPSTPGLQIFVCEDTQMPQCIHIKLKINRHFTMTVFLSVKLFATCSGPLKQCDSPW